MRRVQSKEWCNETIEGRGIPQKNYEYPSLRKAKNVCNLCSSPKDKPHTPLQCQLGDHPNHDPYGKTQNVTTKLSSPYTVSHFRPAHLSDCRFVNEDTTRLEVECIQSSAHTSNA